MSLHAVSTPLTTAQQIRILCYSIFGGAWLIAGSCGRGLALDCGVDLEPRNSAVMDHVDYARGLSGGHRVVATNNTAAAYRILGSFDGQVNCSPFHAHLSGIKHSQPGNVSVTRLHASSMHRSSLVAMAATLTSFNLYYMVKWYQAFAK